MWKSETNGINKGNDDEQNGYAEPGAMSWKRPTRVDRKVIDSLMILVGILWGCCQRFGIFRPSMATPLYMFVHHKCIHIKLVGMGCIGTTHVWASWHVSSAIQDSNWKRVHFWPDDSGTSYGGRRVSAMSVEIVKKKPKTASLIILNIVWCGACQLCHIGVSPGKGPVSDSHIIQLFILLRDCEIPVVFKSHDRSTVNEACGVRQKYTSIRTIPTESLNLFKNNIKYMNIRRTVVLNLGRGTGVTRIIQTRLLESDLQRNWLEIERL